MSHYETLGVARDATAVDIKQAFRRASSAAHPDREGGDHERMAAVNRAYEVLSDPERRAAYDATGDDTPRSTIESEARHMLLSILSAAIDEDKPNLIEACSQILEGHRQGLQQHKNNLSARSARLVKRTGKVRVKKGDNLAQMLIDQKLQQAHEALNQVERGIEVNAAAREMLRHYEQDPEAAQGFPSAASFTAGPIYQMPWPMR